jgi:acyl-CoA hydrolase
MGKRRILPKEAIVTRLVKSEDLNHHGTLFAGRTAEWFVESGFITVANYLEADLLVCVKIHGIQFNKDINAGDIITFNSKVVYAEDENIVVYITAEGQNTKDSKLDGFITFMYVDENTNPTHHNIQVDTNNYLDVELKEKAKNL